MDVAREKTVAPSPLDLFPAVAAAPSRTGRPDFAPWLYSPAETPSSVSSQETRTQDHTTAADTPREPRRQESSQRNSTVDSPRNARRDSKKANPIASDATVKSCADEVESPAREDSQPATATTDQSEDTGTSPLNTEKDSTSKTEEVETNDTVATVLAIPVSVAPLEQITILPAEEPTLVAEATSVATVTAQTGLEEAQSTSSLEKAVTTGTNEIPTSIDHAIPVAAIHSADVVADGVATNLPTEIDLNAGKPTEPKLDNNAQPPLVESNTTEAENRIPQSLVEKNTSPQAGLKEKVVIIEKPDAAPSSESSHLSESTKLEVPASNPTTPNMVSANPEKAITVLQEESKKDSEIDELDLEIRVPKPVEYFEQEQKNPQDNLVIPAAEKSTSEPSHSPQGETRQHGNPSVESAAHGPRPWLHHAGLRTSDPIAGAREIDIARFTQRIAKAFQMAQQRDGEIRLRLHPPELGSLRIELQLQDGQLHARLQTETSEARTLILENLPALKERLAEQNIRVERFDVDLFDATGQQPQQSGGESPGHEQPTFRASKSRLVEPSRVEEVASPTPLAHPHNPKKINIVI